MKGEQDVQIRFYINILISPSEAMPETNPFVLFSFFGENNPDLQRRAPGGADVCAGCGLGAAGPVAGVFRCIVISAL